MRRPRRLGVDTFPFLAVLLAAMGSLILVLLVFDYRAKKAARQRVETAAAKQAAEVEKDAAAKRAELLAQEEARRLEWEKQRDAARRDADAKKAALAVELGKARGEQDEAEQRDAAERQALAKATEQATQERGRIDALRQGVEQGASQVSQAEASSSQARRTLAELGKEIADLERAAADAKAARPADGRTYTVVPYKGKQGSGRRAIYVECAAAGPVFQPDRAAVAPSGIRAEVRRRVERQEPTLSDAERKLPPYLLLLVRPDGIEAYYAVQQALHNERLTFGYEFIEADWQLEFPDTAAEPTGGTGLAGPGGGKAGGPGGAVAGPPGGVGVAVPPAQGTRGPSAGTGTGGVPPPPPPETGPATPGVVPVPGPQSEQPRKPARISPPREWLLFVECKADGVVVHPRKEAFALAKVEAANNPLRAFVTEALTRQPEPTAGKPPSRLRVRFVVHPDGGRSFHAAYPALLGLPIDMDRVALEPGDDVRAVLQGP